MALVMLPSDLPWWPSVQKRLNYLQNANKIDTVIELMQQIHDLCNVSLDPDDDTRDTTIFYGLKSFFENDLTSETEKAQFFTTIKNISKRALTLRNHRPARGLSFSLQQQADTVKLDRFFIAAVLANGFFSTFPKRNEKTHPTLQDFNFTNFFQHLENNNQKAKLRSLLHYFDWFESSFSSTQSNQKDSSTNYVQFSRKVMTGKQWLTIEDWVECNLPLCPIDIKHQGRIENTSNNNDTLNAIHTIFTSPRIGGEILRNGNSQDSIQFFTMPETIICLLFIEALEDNEALFIENVYQLARINDPKNRAILHILDEPKKVSLICIDPENYCLFPNEQFEEDNILRELNKCLLAFRQNTVCKNINRYKRKDNGSIRLSPVGESGSDSPKDITAIIVRAPSTSNTFNSSLEEASSMFNDIEKRRSLLTPEICRGKLENSDSVRQNRKRNFIILGSSGEYLPINRDQIAYSFDSSAYSSCDSFEDDEFHTARNSFEDETNNCVGYDNDIGIVSTNQKRNALLIEDTPEKRQKFVDKLRQALRQSSNYTESTVSSYPAEINCKGSENEGDGIRMKRTGSTGFVLTEDLLDEDFYKNALEHEKEWVEKFRNKYSALSKKEFNESSKYSFSTDYSSEIDEVCDRISKEFDEVTGKEQMADTNSRDETLLYLANCLLKRTFSEGFPGISMNHDITEDCNIGVTDDNNSQEIKKSENDNKNGRLSWNMRSLSMELAKHKHRLAAQLAFAHSIKELIINRGGVVIELRQKHLGRNINLKAVATGNWGCGSTRNGDIQLKLIIQWLAASVSGLPVLIYYTCGDEQLSKLDTLVRILRDRRWTVGELTIATLEYSKRIIERPKRKKFDQQNLFDKLLGI